MGNTVRTRRVAIPTTRGPLSGVWARPGGAPRWGMVLAHGAGTRLDHPAVAALAGALAVRGAAVLRFNFPYTEAGRRMPDRAPVLVAAWHEVWRWGRRRRGMQDLAMVAAGRSMGGRMASLAAADPGAEAAGFDPDGFVYFAFPLHPPGKPGRERAAHLAAVRKPMLFVSGTRDTMAQTMLLEPVVAGLGRRARLHWIEDADHGFRVPKRTGRTDEDVREEAAEAAARWGTRLEPARRGG